MDNGFASIVRAATDVVRAIARALRSMRVHAAKVTRGIHAWWVKATPNEMTAFLEQAVDHVDLKRRIQAWDNRRRDW